jgi:small acid-soluble spore protein O (minor)
MSKQKAGHPGMNATSSAGKEAAFNNEIPANEQLTEMQRQNNKKRKKNQ